MTRDQQRHQRQQQQTSNFRALVLLNNKQQQGKDQSGGGGEEIFNAPSPVLFTSIHTTRWQPEQQHRYHHSGSVAQND
jgi:hypothetical protein